MFSPGGAGRVPRRAECGGGRPGSIDDTAMPQVVMNAELDEPHGAALLTLRDGLARADGALHQRSARAGSRSFEVVTTLAVRDHSRNIG